MRLPLSCPAPDALPQEAFQYRHHGGMSSEPWGWERYISNCLTNLSTKGDPADQCYNLITLMHCKKSALINNNYQIASVSSA